MCTLLEARQREALTLMSSHQRCPLFGVVLPHPRVLPAPGAGHRSAQSDGCALSLSLTAKAAAHNKHSGFIITSSLYPSQTASHALEQPAHILEEKDVMIKKLDVTSLVMLAHSGVRSGPAL